MEFCSCSKDDSNNRKNLPLGGYHFPFNETLKFHIQQREKNSANVLQKVKIISSIGKKNCLSEAMTTSALNTINNKVAYYFIVLSALPLEL